MTSAERLAALDAALPVLACPVCLLGLERDGGTLRCAAGHAFDVARQGYAALAAAVAAAVPERAAWIADLASGPGTYLAAVLDARPGARGVALDASAPAIRLAAGAHPRAAAATADLRTRIPLRTASIDAALVVFGPRDGAELDRVLAPDGVAVVVIPEPEHLAELRGPFGTLGVAPDKERRLLDRMRPLRLADEERVTRTVLLPAEDVARVVLMGPNGHHLDHDEVRERAAALGPLEVRIAVRVVRFRR